MPRGGQCVAGFLVAPCLTLAISLGLFFGSRAGDAFDTAFWPLLWIAAGIGILLLVRRRTRFLGVGVACGAVASFLIQIGALMTMLFVGGGS